MILHYTEGMSKIGPRLRALRKERGWSLEEMASRAGLSSGFISEVERGLSSLSIASLGAICEALGVPVSSFFAASEDGAMVAKLSEPRARITIEDSRVIYNLLSRTGADRLLDVAAVEFPGSYESPLMGHGGEEFGMVLKGSITLQVGEDRFPLAEGSTFHIVSSHPHCVINTAETSASVLWVRTQTLFV